jgi:hypothetical protein
VLRAVRREDLMRRWRAAAESARVREWPLRWILRGDPAEQLEAAAIPPGEVPGHPLSLFRGRPSAAVLSFPRSLLVDSS